MPAACGLPGVRLLFFAKSFHQEVSMAVSIRLARRGSKKNPIYRIVVSDSRSPRDGRFIENLGIYNPQTDPSIIEVDADKAKEWMANGAQPTNTVRRLLQAKGVL